MLERGFVRRVTNDPNVSSHSPTAISTDLEFPSQTDLDSLRDLPAICQVATANQIDTMNINISFKPDGTAQCLWTEALPLHELGRLEITRASNIEFNNTAQHWEVKDRKRRVRFIARSRSACLEWEQQNLQPD